MSGRFVSHCVHEAFLDFVEEHKSDDKQDERAQGAIAQPEPGELTLPEQRILDSLHDGRDGVERHSQVQFGVGDHTQRIDDRRDIHPEGDDFGEHHLQVAVLGGHGRENHSKTHRHQRQKHYQQREKHDMPVQRQFGARSHIIDIEGREDSQLYGERQQIRRHSHQRHDDSREIDFAEDISIGDKRIGGSTHTSCKITPDSNAQQVKQDCRHSVRRDIGNTTKNHDIHQHRQDRRDDEPQWSEHCLLIRRAEIAVHKEDKHVAIAPYFSPVQRQQSVLWRDDDVPL